MAPRFPLFENCTISLAALVQYMVGRVEPWSVPIAIPLYLFCSKMGPISDVTWYSHVGEASIP